MPTAKNATIAVTLYLVIYLVTLNVSNLYVVAPWLLIASPVLLIWMVISILKDNRQPYPELGKEEWGYSDKKRDELSMF